MRPKHRLTIAGVSLAVLASFAWWLSVLKSMPESQFSENSRMLSMPSFVPAKDSLAPSDIYVPDLKSAQALGPGTLVRDENKALTMLKVGDRLYAQARDPRWRSIKINFQHPQTRIIDGYLPDVGAVFGQHPGGLRYGWVNGPATEARERGIAADKRLDTFIHFTKGPSFGPQSRPAAVPGGTDGANFVWAIELPDGIYSLELAMGDPSYSDHVNSIVVNSLDIVDAGANEGFDIVRCDVEVVDGRLSIRAGPTAKNPVINYLHIEQRYVINTGREL